MLDILEFLQKTPNVHRVYRSVIFVNSFLLEVFHIRLWHVSSVQSDILSSKLVPFSSRLHDTVTVWHLYFFFSPRYVFFFLFVHGVDTSIVIVLESSSDSDPNMCVVDLPQLFSPFDGRSIRNQSFNDVSFHGTGCPPRASSEETEHGSLRCKFRIQSVSIWTKSKKGSKERDWEPTSWNVKWRETMSPLNVDVDDFRHPEDKELELT